jgi:4-hydroxyphenylpyruvate dioxygenase-like putative hemolysin
VIFERYADLRRLGFGAGNLKALSGAIEGEQALRGKL